MSLSELARRFQNPTILPTDEPLDMTDGLTHRKLDLEREFQHDLEFQRQEIAQDQAAEEAKMEAETRGLRLDRIPSDDSQPDLPGIEPGRFTTAQQALQFIFAGNAYFTLRSRATGNRFTYRVATPKRARAKNEEFWYLSLLNGPDNDHNYSYMANLKGRPRPGLKPRFWQTDKCRVGPDAPATKAFLWTLERLVAGRLPDNLEVWHEARCGRCGRRLTVPESIASGIGPECAGRLGR